ncbi:MAG: c-type cytochrome biogenesis protein CcsB [Methanosarcinaceae archaeon]|nr:c-type cytochrome biogenesis protein CcsB [Methanosarcinaceae archaeon]
MDNLFLYIIFILNICVIVSSFSLFLSKRKEASLILDIFLLFHFLAFTTFLILFSFKLGRLPLATLYEFSLLFVWSIILFSILLGLKIRNPSILLLISSTTLILFTFVSLLPHEPTGLMPALQSKWLEAHVATAIVAYGLFTISFCAGILYLINNRFSNTILSENSPSQNILTKTIHRLIQVGFFALTLVLITGSIWAEEVWGSWWSWDPKETWALATWFLYAAYLHLQSKGKKHEKSSVILSVFGFLVVLFTLFGVSYLMYGLHSY